MERFLAVLNQIDRIRSRLSRLVEQWIRVRQADFLVRQRAELLNLSLLAMMLVIACFWGFDLLRSLVINRWVLNPIIGLVLLGASGLTFALNRRGHTQLAANFYLMVLILVISLAIPGGALEPATLLYMVPLILCGFVQPPDMVFFHAILAVVAAVMMALLHGLSLRLLYLPVPALFFAALVIWLGTSRWEKVQQRLYQERQQLNQAIDRALDGWAHAIEVADRETPGHTRRVTELALALGRQLGIPDDQMDDLRRGAMLHDIGKMDIPEQILRKTGALDEQESALMQRHTVYAYEMLRDLPLLKSAVDIALYHHEAWDGSGYPSGLKGEQIPWLARIFSVADVWDSLASDRPYRLSWPKPQIRAYLLNEAGRHFDPMVVEALTHLEIWRGS